MGKPPAFQTYASDYFMDTNSWTVDEIGIYQRLLLTEWVNGGLPNDEKRLARIAGCSTKKFQKGWTTIKIKFILNNSNFYINKKLEEVRDDQAKYRELQSQKGLKSASKRWGYDITTVKNRLQPKSNPSSSTSSSKRNKILSDEEWKEEILKLNPHIDWNVLNREIDTWLLNHPNRKKTRKFISNWILNKQEDKPMDTKHESW